MIFVDTSFFFALASVRDADHGRAVEALHPFEGLDLPRHLVTSNHVVGECITLTRRRVSHQAAVGMGKRLYSEKLASIHWATPEEEALAFNELQRFQDKVYSSRGLPELRPHATTWNSRGAGVGF